MLRSNLAQLNQAMFLTQAIALFAVSSILGQHLVVLRSIGATIATSKIIISIYNL